MAANISYRTKRSDFFVHPKTAGLSPFAQCLWNQALLSNIAGVLQRSERLMAKVGAMTAEQVRSGIAELEQRGLCKYFEDDEVLWLIEAADEQATNPNAWKHVWAVVDTAPQLVREAFEVRYSRAGGRPAAKGIGYPIAYPIPDPQTQLETALIGPPNPTPITQEQEQEQEKEQEQEQEQENTRDPSPPVPPAPPAPVLHSSDPPLDRCIREVNAARAKRKLDPISRMQGREVESLLFHALEICQDVEAAYGAYLQRGDQWDADRGFPIAKWAKTPMHWLTAKATVRRVGHTRAEDFSAEHAATPEGPLDLNKLRSNRRATP